MITLTLSRFGSKGNEDVLHTFKSTSNRASPSDGLMPYLWHSLVCVWEGAYISSEMQYFIAPSIGLKKNGRTIKRKSISSLKQLKMKKILKKKKKSAVGQRQQWHQINK